MNWEQLLSTERARNTGRKQGCAADLRSEFEKDYHRIIGSASFRRLQDKTQVFPLDQSDFIRTRLTHSLEVSSIAKSLGQNIGENILAFQNDASFTPRMKEDICHILQCAGLIHDIGNPPFGHFGEVAIREWFAENLPRLQYRGQSVDEVLSEQMKQDFYHFEGNAQALRLVTRLHFLVDENGMNLTCALLNTIIKYPVSSLETDDTCGDIKKKKIGYYLADEDIFHRIEHATGTNGNRHPLTFILEAADDIAYKTADIEDAFVKGFISYQMLLEELKSLKCIQKNKNVSFDPAGRLEQLYRRGVEKQVDQPEEYAVKNWIVRAQGFLIDCATEGFTSHYQEIMDGSWKHDLFFRTAAQELMELLGSVAMRRVFSTRQIYLMELVEAGIINYLMDCFVKAVIHYDDDDSALDSIDRRLVYFISTNYKNAYHHQAKGKSEIQRLYLRLLLVTDFICGMTDSYAKRLYQELKAVL